MSTMVLIESWSWSRQPKLVHLVRCFEVSFFASALWTPVDDCLFPKQEFGVTNTPSRYLFCDQYTKGFRVPKNGLFITQPPDGVEMSQWDYPFLWKIFLAVEGPQKSSSSFCREPVTFLPPMVIQSCSFGKELLINLPVQWAASRPSLQVYPLWYLCIP